MCKIPMRLLIQLNLDSLPGELSTLFGNGLLQLFYCTEYECEYGGDMGESGLLKLLQPEDSTSEQNSPAIDAPFPQEPLSAGTKWTTILMMKTVNRMENH